MEDLCDGEFISRRWLFVMFGLLRDGENGDHVRAVFEDFVNLIDEYEKHPFVLLFGRHDFQRGDRVHALSFQGGLVRVARWASATAARQR